MSMSDHHAPGTNIQTQALQLAFEDANVNMGGQAAYMQPPQMESHGSTRHMQTLTPSSPSPRTQWPDTNNRTPVNGGRMQEQRVFKELQDRGNGMNKG